MKRRAYAVLSTARGVGTLVISALSWLALARVSAPARH